MYTVTENNGEIGKKITNATKVFKPIIKKRKVEEDEEQNFNIICRDEIKGKKRKNQVSFGEKDSSILVKNEQYQQKEAEFNQSIMDIVNGVNKVVVKCANNKKQKKKVSKPTEEEREEADKSVKESRDVEETQEKETVETNKKEDGNEKSWSRNRDMNVVQVEKRFHQLVGDFKDEKFTAYGLNPSTPFLHQMWKLWFEAVGQNDYVHYDYDNDLFVLNEKTIMNAKEILLWDGSIDMFDRKSGFKMICIRRHLYNEGILLLSAYGGQTKYKALNKSFVKFVLHYISTIRAHAGLNTCIKILCVNPENTGEVVLKHPFFGCSVSKVGLDYLSDFNRDFLMCNVNNIQYKEEKNKISAKQSSKNNNKPTESEQESE